MKFYDTSCLLRIGEVAFKEPFATSSVVINELENIKTSKNKSEDVRYMARKLVRCFNTYDNYKIIIHSKEHDRIVDEFDLPLTNDNIIAATAYCMSNNHEVVFITDDIILRLVAKNIFNLEVGDVFKDEIEQYTGFKDIVMSDDEMANFYSNIEFNHFNSLINEYLIIRNKDLEEVDLLKWSGNCYIATPKHTLRTFAFGDKIKPKDSYQKMAVDSIMNNTMTAIGGKAGSGKSLLAITSAMRLVETGKYDKIVIMFNPTNTRGASRLGFYAGDMLDKAMQSSIGNILITKFGERYAVDTLISQNKLKLISMADCRGMEVRDNEILYVTECQNASIDLLKLVLSRASQEAKIIIEGDYCSQVDDYMFEGDNNGMRRAIDVLKGEDIFGFVELQNVWRSKLAEIVEKM